jgi:hypothetical protein
MLRFEIFSNLNFVVIWENFEHKNVPIWKYSDLNFLILKNILIKNPM